MGFIASPMAEDREPSPSGDWLKIDEPVVRSKSSSTGVKPAGVGRTYGVTGLLAVAAVLNSEGLPAPAAPGVLYRATGVAIVGIAPYVLGRTAATGVANVVYDAATAAGVRCLTENTFVVCTMGRMNR